MSTDVRLSTTCQKGVAMDWIIWLVLGLAAGVLALLVIERRIPREPMGWIGALLVGLIGGVLGGWIANLLGLETANWIGSLVVAFAGAALILYILQRTGVRHA
jgi:uncharacterized membrane protein YeaQ/YmgE (transglycosylase-associated protein family)